MICCSHPHGVSSSEPPVGVYFDFKPYLGTCSGVIMHAEKTLQIINLIMLLSEFIAKPKLYKGRINKRGG